MSTIAAVIGRILIAAIFLVSGAGKLVDPAGAEAMITGVGFPPGLGIVAGLFEVAAGICLAIGLMTRLVAVLLFGFVALATLLFHNRVNDPLELAMALKNLAIMGGLLLVFAHSQMWWSYDAMRRSRKAELTVSDAEQRAHEAEIRAARAEGRAEVSRTVPADGSRELSAAEQRAHEAEIRVARAEGRAEVERTVPANRVVTDVDGDGVPEVRKRRWF